MTSEIDNLNPPQPGLTNLFKKMKKIDKNEYTNLHRWIKRNKPKGNLCEDCGKNKKLEAANISGYYKKDVNDFRWICRLCHMESDGRLGLIKKRNKKFLTKGILNGRSKLNEKQVRLIRHLYVIKPWVKNEKLAKIFNISHSVISKIQTNKSWKHITI